MLNALYQYAVERQLALPVGFVAKTVKAFLCLGADGRFLGLERSDGRPYAAPDIGSRSSASDQAPSSPETTHSISTMVPRSSKSPASYSCETTLALELLAAPPVT